MKTSHRSLVACTFCAVSAALGGTPADPTQPSAQWLTAQPSSGAASAPVAKGQPMETQVIVYSAERKIAVVDGMLVRIGDTYNGERLVSMKPNEVRWKHSERAASEARPAIVKKILRSGENK